MRVDILLADAAQTDGQHGKAHILGAGWSVSLAAPSPMAVVVFLEVGWEESNREFRWQLELLNQDGRRVELPGPAGPQQFVVEGTLEAGRPPGIPEGTPIALPPLSINVGPLPLEAGRYEWRVSIAEPRGEMRSEETWHRAFTKVSPPPGPAP